MWGFKNHSSSSVFIPTQSVHSVSFNNFPISDCENYRSYKQIPEGKNYRCIGRKEVFQKFFIILIFQEDILTLIHPTYNLVTSAKKMICQDYYAVRGILVVERCKASAMPHSILYEFYDYFNFKGYIISLIYNATYILV